METIGKIGILVFSLVMAGLCFVFINKYFSSFISTIQNNYSRPVPQITSMSVFTDNFTGQEALQEAGSSNGSSSIYWWLNSGGIFNINNGIASTNQGELPTYNRWRIAYSFSNPIDTNQGYRPQNIFRLVTRSKWNNFEQQIYFRINKDNLTNSPQRNESNGVFLFNRYLDGNNLYYTGIRVDGAFVVKKKYQGKYYTLSHVNYYPGKYDLSTNPTLLPKNTWIGIKSKLTTDAQGNVNIKMYSDLDQSGKWNLLLETTDKPGQNGLSVINTAGFAGIRTDFMDVEFKEYRIEEIN